MLKNFFSRTKAEMSSQAIVTVILLVVGFFLILVVYYQFNFTERSDKDVCHESVVLRGTIPDVLGTGELSPLKCKTSKICAGEKNLINRGKCEEFVNVENVNYVNMEDVEDAEKLISQEVVDCWNTMGQGELSLFSEGAAQLGFGSVYSSCVICSRVAFDKENLEKNKIDLNQMNVLEYMLTHKAPGQEESYYQFLSKGEGAKFSISDTLDFPVINESGKANGSVEIDLTNAVEESDWNSEEIAVLFMQISAPSRGEATINFVKLLGTGAIVGGNMGGFKLAGKAAEVCSKIPYCGAVVAVGSVLTLAYQQVNIGNNQAITAMHCGDVSVGDNARNGCSVVRTVKYNPEEIRSYCGIIESIP